MRWGVPPGRGAVSAACLSAVGRAGSPSQVGVGVSAVCTLMYDCVTRGGTKGKNVYPGYTHTEAAR